MIWPVGDQTDAGVHVAVGVGLWALAGAVVVIAISLASPSHAWCAAWFISLCVVALLIGLAGTAFVVGPFRGWNLPLTAASKLARPDVKISTLSVFAIADKTPSGGAAIIIHVGFINEGGGDIERATLSFLAPDFATSVVRCDERGNPTGKGDQNRTSEGTLMDPESGVPVAGQTGSLFWAERNVTFDAHTAVPAYFRVDVPELPERLPVRVFVVSSAFPGHVVYAQGDFSLESQE
jgi:hypothetical protein